MRHIRSWLWLLVRRSRGGTQHTAGVREVAPTAGDVDRLIVRDDGDRTWLVVYGGGEDEPLIQAALTPCERRLLAWALHPDNQYEKE